MLSWRRIFSIRRQSDEVLSVRAMLSKFRDLVQKNNQALELIADAGEKLGGEYIFDTQYLRSLAQDLTRSIRDIVYSLNDMTRGRYRELADAACRIDNEIWAVIESRVVALESDLVIPFERIDGDMIDAVGEKLARLGELARRLGCRVPDGFVVSARACRQVLEAAGIDKLIRGWDASARGDESLHALSGRLQERLSSAALPPAIARDIQRSVTRLTRRTKHAHLAVRSSALGEDGDLSFAGQYRTVLGVNPAYVLDAYREVIASLYATEVMRYRVSNGLHPAAGLMAVGFMGMIPASSAGVLYTLDPSDPRRNVLIVSAALGLGQPVADGSGQADRFELSRTPPHQLVSRRIMPKKTALAVGSSGGTEGVEIPLIRQRQPAVSDDQLKELAEVALRVEHCLKTAMDIEFAYDHSGRLFILQARPLRLSPEPVQARPESRSPSLEYPVLLENRGEVACRGVGCGPVRLVRSQDDLNALPEDAVLVSRSASPWLAAALPRVSAVVTDIGSAAGHLAAVAREYRVPAIVDTQAATQVLQSEQEVTVDADENIIYRGRVEDLVREQLLRACPYENRLEFRLLRRMLRKIAPLSLTDPSSRQFVPRNCRTYHDIIRFAHEKAVEAVVSACQTRLSRPSPLVYKLELDIPLDLVVVDLRIDVETEPGSSSVDVDHLRSKPLLALITGLTTKGIWSTGPADMDLGGFLSSATSSATVSGLQNTRPEQNLAIVSEDYLNLSLKVGYHFNIVECQLTANPKENFIRFRFAGGVTELTRRSRRAALLKKILENFDFVVENKGDLVIGQIRLLSEDRTIERLEMIGRLIGFTRQLDIHLRTDDLVESYVEGFMSGNYEPVGSRNA